LEESHTAEVKSRGGHDAFLPSEGMRRAKRHRDVSKSGDGSPWPHSIPGFMFGQVEVHYTRHQHPAIRTEHCIADPNCVVDRMEYRLARHHVPDVNPALIATGSLLWATVSSRVSCRG